MSPELRLLLLVCRSRINTFNLSREELEKVLNDGIDWLEFSRLILYHRINPVIYPQLQRQLADIVPPAIKKILTRDFNHNRLFALNTTAELVRINRLIDAEEIPVFNLKGPLLALQLYGDVANRHCGDIDLLARPNDIAPLHNIVTQQGYVIQDALPAKTFSTPKYLKAYMAAQYHTGYIHPHSGIRLEIHFSLFKNRRYFPILPAEDFDNPSRWQSFELGGTPIRSLTPVDEILYYLAHGANHKWFRLKWLVDIALCCKAGATPWDAVVQRARQLQLKRPVSQGLMLACLLLGAPLPQAFSGLKVKPSIHKTLTLDGLGEILRTEAETKRKHRFPELRKKAYLMRLKPSLGYKLGHLRMLLYADVNRQVLALPEPLFFLYYFLNPFLWLYRKMFKWQPPDR